ncbi:hypothetical protein ES703_44641 [subsurface metagenome]
MRSNSKLVTTLGIRPYPYSPFIAASNGSKPGVRTSEPTSISSSFGSSSAKIALASQALEHPLQSSFPVILRQCSRSIVYLRGTA